MRCFTLWKERGEAGKAAELGNSIFDEGKIYLENLACAC